ncbi:MAG: phosphoribosylformylglycinamidine synthase subunit PurL [Sulfuricurvum sp.]
MSNQLPNIDEILASHKLSQDDYKSIKEILGREPNLVEIGIFSAMWSEHCSYKSSKVHLSGFPTKAPWVIQGPGENAGVIDIGGGYAAVFKMESHNHPSYVDPYNGAATGLGGMMRDVFTMGARPIATLNLLRFGDLRSDDAKIASYHKHLVKECARGMSEYGNEVGVASIGGDTGFDECYNGNILVNAMNVGLAKSDEIFYGRAEGIGNPVIYVGADTGRDGLGGAVMSSDSFSDADEGESNVAVGDPVAEKNLIEACMEMFATDLVVGIQDMGAAGLTSSSFEMAGRAGSGMVMHLDRVPARHKDMQPYEFMLSESQERMLVCAKKGGEDALMEIFRRHNLECVVVGEVTDSGRMELFWHGEKVADVPVAPVSESSPVLNRPMSRPAYLDEVAKVSIDDFAKVPNQEAFERLISALEVTDKSAIYGGFDKSKQAIKGCGSLDASVFFIEQNNSALAMAAGCNARYCYIDPKGGAAVAVIEAARNVAISGATPLAVTDCLNYGNPENPEVMWQFGEGCLGIKEACNELNTPVIGGNVSLYNETNSVSIFPTPAIGVVGVNSDPSKVLGSSFKSEGNLIYLVGESRSEFGGSLYMKEICSSVGGTLPNIDYDKERALWKLIIEANAKGLLSSAKDASSGGVAIALAKMSALSSLGCSATMSVSDERDIFAESLSRVIVEVSEQNAPAFEAMASDLGYQKIGVVGGSEFRLNNVKMDLAKLKDTYFGTFAKDLL